MSLNRNEKAAVVTDVAAQAAKLQTLALAEYRGITVGAHERAAQRRRASKGVYLHVLKNTLARRAVAARRSRWPSDSMVGPLIYGFSEDAVAAAKVHRRLRQDQRQAGHQGGAYAGKALDVERRARRWPPSRRKEVLLSQLLGLMQSPISRMARVLAALAEKRGGARSAAPKLPARSSRRLSLTLEHIQPII